LFTAFGLNLGNQVASASSLPLGTALGGSKVTISDAAGVTSTALLNYVSPGQINFLTPTGLANGTATITITNWAGELNTFPVQVANVAPGLFSADATGQGAAAAGVLTVAADGTRSNSVAADCTTTPGKCVTVPIDLGSPATSVYLSLYGTGIRRRSSLDNVTVTIGGVPVTPLYAGTQSQYPGLDQINLQLPRSLAGLGEADVVVSVDGQAANVVRVAVR
jgi:uncharacterized protein (TIGR03437 family)